MLQLLLAVIVVADTDKPLHHWELGVVTELILGADRLCRAAVVRTPRGRTSRSITKLYPLEENVDSIEANVDSSIEVSEKNLRKSPRPTRKAAFQARDALMAQLIDELPD